MKYWRNACQLRVVDAIVAEQPADGGVVTVGRDHEAGGQLGAVGERHADRGPVVVDGGDGRALAHVDALRASVVDQRGVELGARDHTGIRTLGRQRHLDLAAAR